MSSTEEKIQVPNMHVEGEKPTEAEGLNGNEESPRKTQGVGKTRTFWDKVPPWVSSNLRSHRSLKLWLRCWIASWVCFVIILPQKSLSALGNAAFFALLASTMIPANMPVQLFIFVLFTVIVGMCLGWGFGAAAMRAALASRNQLVLKQSLQKEAQSAAGLANPDALFQSDIFQGKFLDTNSSIVFGCFLGLANFIFALMRAYAPKLAIMSVFGTIAVDIFCSYGPLFPFAQYTIINSLLISMACYIGIGIIVIILVFPETLNHSFLVSTSDLLAKLQGLVDTQEEVLHSTSADLASDGPVIGKIVGMRAAVLGQYQRIMATSNFINLEFSWGKWNGDDVKALGEPLLGVVSRTAALQSFARLLGHPASRDFETSGDTESITTDSDSGASSYTGDTYLLRQLRERNQTAEAEYSVRMTDILPVIRDSTSELREACSAGIASVKAVIDSINTKRYARKGARDSEERVQDLSNAIGHLRQAMETFKDSKRLLLAEPFQALIQARLKNGNHPVPLRMLYYSYVFGANLLVLADAILSLMEVVKATAMKRTKNRLWAPSSLRAIVKAIVSRGDSSDEAIGEDEVLESEGEAERDVRSYRQDPDSRPPTNVLQRIANVIHAFYGWTKTPEALFAFKYVIVTICLWLPAVFRQSAEFNYVQKGLWALIMAQTTMNIYASDQIFNYVMRLLGTFVGAVAGLLTWYIGSAKSNGSPYGAAASVAVFLMPIVFLRLFSPPHYLPGVLLGGATWALVIGYSWINGHLPIVGNVGVGWPIAWRRWVTVMIGCAGSFILMMLPPQSGRKAVRYKNASTIAGLGFIYSEVLAAWISDKETGGDKSFPYTSEWMPGFRDRLMKIGTKIQAIKAQTAIAKWEGSIRGAWPFEEYIALANVQTEMVANLAQLGSALAHVDHQLRIKYLQNTRSVNPNFIADVMATFSIVSQALRTGDPLPEAFHQNLLDRLHYHGAVGSKSLPKPRPGADADESDTSNPLHSVMTYEYMFYASALMAVFQFLDGLNEARRITTRLCGEVPLQGFARWKDQFERAHVLV